MEGGELPHAPLEVRPVVQTRAEDDLGVAVEAAEASARGLLDALGARRGPARRA